MNKLAALPAGTFPESVRLHIPRAVRVIYDIRNKRNTAHLSDGIDPNMQDATLVGSTMAWILAELVRLHHSVPPQEAQRIIDGLITREVPMIQMFDDHPRLLKDIGASDHVLVLLYWVGSPGVKRATLSQWLPLSMRTNLSRTLAKLHATHLVHYVDSTAKITLLGEREVELRSLVAPL